MGMGKYSSPKIEELLRWSKIAEVNTMLDNGVSPSKVCKFINENGFKISAPMIYEYNTVRKTNIAKDINYESAINPIDKNKLFQADEVSYVVNKDRVKNELDTLDEIIERGWRTLLKTPDMPVPPQLMMKAIELKNNITKGGHDHLTNYGIQDIKTIEQGKFKAVLNALLNFVPMDKRNDAIDAIETAEENYYKGTEYYESYLQNKMLQEEEVSNFENEDE